MIKKSIRVLVMIILLFSIILGCVACGITIDVGDDSNGDEQTGGGSDDSDDSDDSDGEDLNVEPESNEGATVELTVGTLSSTYEQSLMQAWINAFQKLHSEVSITISTTISGMVDIITRDSAGTLPDIIWTAGDQHSPYSGTGYFQDLSDESVFEGSSEFFSGFYDTLIETTHYSEGDDGIWFVPRDYNRLVVYYNVTAFEQAGVDVPKNGWTWDDFLETCQELMDAGVKRAVEYYIGWPPICTTMLTNYGGTYLTTSNGTVEAALDSEETEACYDFLNEMIYGDDAFAITGSGSGFKAYDPETGLSTCVPMIIDVRPQLTEYAAAAYSSNWSLQAVSFPNFKQEDGSDGYVGTGCSGYAITKACTDSEELAWAWEFLKYCMSEDGYNTVAYLGNIVPAITSMADSGDWLDTYVYGQLVDYEAFIAKDTNDLFLNYYNVVSDVTQHDIIKNQASVFWSCVGSSTYSKAVKEFVESINSIL